MRRDPDARDTARAATLGPSLAPGERDAALQAICASARAEFGASACSVALVDPTTEELVYVASDGAGADAIVGQRMALSRGIAGFAVAAGQTLAVDDVRRDARFAADMAERTGYVPSTLLAVPISEGDTPLGVLSVLDRSVSGAEALALAGRFSAVLTPLLERAASSADDVRADADLDAAVAAVRTLEPADRAAAARMLVDFADSAPPRRR